MGRKKLNTGTALIYDVKTRINQANFDRLNAWLSNSSYRNMAELLRDIICEGKITVYTEDKSMRDICTQLMKIRGELNAIGRNVNQATRSLHTGELKGTRLLKLLEVLEFSKQVDAKVELLFPQISELVKVWLRR